MLYSAEAADDQKEEIILAEDHKEEIILAEEKKGM